MCRRPTAVATLLFFALCWSVPVAAVMARERGCEEHLASVVRVLHDSAGAQPLAPMLLTWPKATASAPCLEKAKEYSDIMYATTIMPEEMADARQQIVANHLALLGMPKLANLVGKSR
eukprot:NODE_17864_length_922_cov_4.948428.p1 GENE.NODE_17864_length_922_cov_4.948428~~NODE_17864_length_922_cov_4.948428.p1  ORF type:complete len:118 (+),score=13.63 NODE_17864_length_922_cov_4.948428:62-415(+)